MQRCSPEFYAQPHAYGWDGAVIVNSSVAPRSTYGLCSQNGLGSVERGEEAAQGFDLRPLMDGDVRLPGIVVHGGLVIALRLIEGFPEFERRCDR